MKKIYFAHPMTTYLRPDETAAREILEKLIDKSSMKVICPRQDLMEVFSTRDVQNLNGAQAMERCLNYVKNRADAICVLSIGGFLPKGCHDEVVAAFQAEKPVFYIAKMPERYIVAKLERENLALWNPNDWKATYAKIHGEVVLSEWTYVGFGGLGISYPVHLQQGFSIFAKEKAEV